MGSMGGYVFSQLLVDGCQKCIVALCFLKSVSSLFVF